jgi:hypothetical protein
MLKFKHRITDRRYWERFAMWCWRMEKTSWTDYVTNEILHSIKEKKIILRKIKRRLIELVDSSVRTAFCNMLLRER